MKTVSLLILLMIAVVGLASAEGPQNPAGEPQTLKEGSWVCTTPEAYDQAVQEERNWQGNDLEELKKGLRERKLCSYIDKEYLDGLKFFQVLNRQGDKVKVSFVVEFTKRIELLHRQITLVKYTGWTDAGNLRSLQY